jgi:mannonate dehydratase
MVGYEDRLAQAVEPEKIAPIAEEDVWQDTQAFLAEITPVAEAAGVMLSHHPADPPVPSLRGVAKILKSAEDFDRLFEMSPSPANKMIFCLGCFSQLYEPSKVYDAIRHFKDRIAEIHFRNVQGDMSDFTEVYPDEGKLDMVAVLRTLKEVGYTGPVVIDHTPHGTDDTVYGHRGRAFAFGYLRGILQAIGASD